MPEYGVWGDMIQRCTNPKNKAFGYYGGRGIVVCERWRSFENFFADMGPRPAGTSLDRRNNDANYEPSNCRWATASEQMSNRRRWGTQHKQYTRRVFLEFNGERKSMFKWSRDLGITYNGLRHRLNHWPIEKALSSPAGETKSPTPQTSNPKQ